MQTFSVSSLRHAASKPALANNQATRPSILESPPIRARASQTSWTSLPQQNRDSVVARAAQGGPPGPSDRVDEPSTSNFFNRDDRVDPTTRLNRSLRGIPRRIDSYFKGRWDRQAIWCFISFGSGYYVANTISLSFGALAINDVVAAAIMVTFYELVSYYYFTSSKLSLRLLFLNWTKMGIVAGFIADALKLGG